MMPITQPPMIPDTEKIINLIALSISLGHDNRYEEALSCLDLAIGIDPDFFPVYINRGMILTAMERYEESVECFEHVLNLQPNFVQAAQLRNDSLQAALKAYDDKLVLIQNSAELFYKRGVILLKLQRFEEALHSQNRALAIEPEHVEGLNQRGNVLLELNRHQEALVCYEQILAIIPDSAIALTNRGNVLQKNGRIDEALASYGRALALTPNLAEAIIEQAHCNLLLGNFQDGWQQFESRWKTRQLQGKDLKTLAIKWSGEHSLAHKSILLWAEQGLGDTIQFVRYVPLLVHQAQRVILRVPAELRSLLQTIHKSSDIEIITEQETLPPHDFHCPLMSLPYAFGTRLQTIPVDVPYLRADPVQVENWKNKLGPKTQPRIGIV
ncbi:MAG: tetratricopeptide repeat protein, partial [Burkholderiaceae bacterium]